MDTSHINTNTLSGTFGGTLLVLLLHVNWVGLLNTALIAAVGAISSYTVSMALGWIGRRMRRKEMIMK